MGKKYEDKMEDDYAKWRLVGATHRQITKANELRDDEVSKEDKVSKEEKANFALKELSQRFVYKNAYDLALKQLLR